MPNTRIDLRAGEVLFNEGDPPTTAFLIETGRIVVSMRAGGATVELGQLAAGDLLGEMAVIDRSPRTATARALEDSVLLPVGGEQILERVADADPIIRALLRGQLARYRTALDALRQGDNASNSMASRPAATGESSTEQREDAAAIDKIRLETQLRDALARGGLEVRYQPLLDIDTGRIAGYEALIRWDHPTRGAVSPAEFIRLAEETSLIVPVGYHVFAEVARTLARLADEAPGTPPFIAVNVSARQLEEPEFLAEVVAIATAAKAPLAAIKIEVTESLTLDVERVGTLIGRAHELGMTVALDDFGTGFSNLGHLHRLHFDTVKLDQGFVRQMLDHPRVHAIVQAIATMVAALDADMVAEGVETDAQLDALRAIGCRYAQGWLIGRPLDLDAVIAQQRAR